MSDVERICKQCPEERRCERRILLLQEAPDGKTWYLCIRCWVDWDRDERAGITIGVVMPVAVVPVATNGATVTVAATPPVASTTIPLPGGDGTLTRTSSSTTARKPRKPRSSS